MMKYTIVEPSTKLHNISVLGKNKADGISQIANLITHKGKFNMPYNVEVTNLKTGDTSLYLVDVMDFVLPGGRRMALYKRYAGRKWDDVKFIPTP